MQQTKRVGKTILSCLLSFLLALSIVLTAVCGALSFTLHAPQFAVAVVHATDYATHLQKELHDDFINYGSAANIDESFFDTLFGEVITADRVEEDTKTMFREFYSGTPKAVNTADLEKNLLERLQRYAKDKGYYVDHTLQGNLEQITEELCKMYSGYVSVFSNKYFETASKTMANFRPIALYGLGIGAVFSLLSAVLLLLLQKEKADKFAYLIYAASGAALMLLVAPAALLLSGITNRISIATKSLFTLAKGTMNGACIAVLVMALIPIVLTIVFAMLYTRQEDSNGE